MPNSTFVQAVLASSRNGDRLVEDAELLYDMERFPTAYALAVLSEEEYAKSLLLSLVNVGALPWSSDVQRALHDHVCKQLASVILDYLCPEVDEFIRRCSPSTSASDPWLFPKHVVDAIQVIVHERIPKDRHRLWLDASDRPLDTGVKQIAGGSIDQCKQNAIYVDVEKAGQVRSEPSSITQSIARAEIDRAKRIGNDLRAYDGEPGPRASLDLEKLVGVFKLLTKQVSVEEFNAYWWVKWSRRANSPQQMPFRSKAPHVASPRVLHTAFDCISFRSSLLVSASVTVRVAGQNQSLDHEHRMITTQELAFRTAREFLAALDPLENIWAPQPSSWIFRGHEDDRYSLVPAAMRREVTLAIEDSDRRPYWGAYNDRLLAEYQAVQRFCDLADEQGLPVSDPTARMLGQTLRSNVATYLNRAAEGHEYFPRSEDYGVFALAQHYGILTRLLDWSHHPYVAAWFAARGAAKTQIFVHSEVSSRCTCIVSFSMRHPRARHL